MLLTRQTDNAVLLVKRHSEPVMGLYWYPGGRLLYGEGFGEAAVRKVRKEIGIEASACGNALGTWNTQFETSAWGGPTHTINILVHATTNDPKATALRICGDRRGRCGDGAFGQFRWVHPDTTVGEEVYILEGLARLRARGGRCE